MPPGLRRELGMLDAAMITIGGIIGSGIFFVPSRVAAEFPDAGAVMLIWLAGGLVSLAGALTVAELATMFPRAGGPYVFVREAFGRVPGFIAGWSYFVLGKAAIGAAVLLVFAEYVGYFAPLTPLGKQLLAVWAAGSLAYVNALGVRQGARVQNVLTLLKAGALAVLVLAALLLAPAAGPQPSFVGEGNLSAALVLVLFAYNAWINATFVGEEMRNPGRDLPRALALGTLGVMVLYLGANLAYLRVLGPAGMAASPLVATDTMQRAFAFGGAFIAGSILVSTYGNANGGTLTGARIPLAMARQGELPRALGHLNRAGAPDVALLAEFLLTAALILSGTFQTAATLGIVAIWAVLAAVALAVVVLRRKLPHVHRPYRVPLYPLVPAVFLAGALGVLGLSVAQQREQALLSFALMLSGLPVLWWTRRATRRHAAPV
ncbi:MAG: amino acid permease [Halobacteriales archaeon]|nr:amino acid permease [Halobacteriales archaeon]